MNIFSQILLKLACHHKWNLIKEMYTYTVYASGRRSENPTAVYNTYCCTECGKFKKVKL